MLFIGATISILVATLYPSKNSISFDIWSYDKVGHFVMFTVWTFLFGLYRAFKKNKRPNLFIVFSLGSFYGLLIELLQFVIPTNRSPETLDFVADVFGSLFAIWLLDLCFKIIFKDKEVT